MLVFHPALFAITVFVCLFISYAGGSGQGLSLRLSWRLFFCFHVEIKFSCFAKRRKKNNIWIGVTHHLEKHKFDKSMKKVRIWRHERNEIIHDSNIKVLQSSLTYERIVRKKKQKDWKSQNYMYTWFNRTWNKSEQEQYETCLWICFGM